METITIQEVFGPPPNLRQIEPYIGHRTPSQLWQEVAAAKFDPTDVLAFADMLSMFIKADDHAIALYFGALDELERHPEPKAVDTNVMGACVSLFMTCARCGRSDELEPVPDAIPNLSFAELERKGIRREILASLRSAFIFR